MVHLALFRFFTQITHLFTQPSSLLPLFCYFSYLHKHHITKSKTSTPVVRTGVIPTCRSPSPPAVASLTHGPRDCPASLSHLPNDRPMHYRFFIFWPRGLTPGPKFTKRGDDLVDSEIYHPAKFHRSTPTHARDIHYQKSCGQKNSKRYIPNMSIGMWG